MQRMKTQELIHTARVRQALKHAAASDKLVSNGKRVRARKVMDLYGSCCEILKYSQVYEPYRSIVGQERGRTHRNLNERRKIN